MTAGAWIPAKATAAALSYSTIRTPARLRSASSVGAKAADYVVALVEDANAPTHSPHVGHTGGDANGRVGFSCQLG